jgi:hypothetical protein
VTVHKGGQTGNQNAAKDKDKTNNRITINRSSNHPDTNQGILRRLAKQGRDDLLDRVASGELRKDFTPTERVAIAKAIEEEIGKIARERQIALAGTRPNTGDLPVDRPEATGNETRAIAAEKSGFGSEVTYRRAKKALDIFPAAVAN